MSIGVGGGAFALVSHEESIFGLDAAGPAPALVPPTDGGTSHLCVADADRMSVSFIGSLFLDFGDRSRFRINGSEVLLEEGLWPHADELGAHGYAPMLSADWTNFGCGQAIVIDGDVLLGGADPRMDGCAAPA
jgi:gamma-glutamyltranspeptidase